MLKIIGIFIFGTALPFAEDNKAGIPTTVLNIPNNIDYPQESMTLTIHLPNKIEPSKEAQDLSKKKIIPRHIEFNSHPFEKISEKSRFRVVMNQFVKKGIIKSAYDVQTIESPIRIMKEQAARITIRVHQALVALEKTSQLRTFNVRIEDIKNMKEMVDEFQKQIKMFTYQPTEMQKDLDRLEEKVNKATGKGTIQITGITQGDDGTTVNLEITRE